MNERDPRASEHTSDAHSGRELFEAITNNTEMGLSLSLLDLIQRAAQLPTQSHTYDLLDPILIPASTQHPAELQWRVLFTAGHKELDTPAAIQVPLLGDSLGTLTLSHIGHTPLTLPVHSAEVVANIEKNAAHNPNATARTTLFINEREPLIDPSTGEPRLLPGVRASFNKEGDLHALLVRAPGNRRLATLALNGLRFTPEAVAATINERIDDTLAAYTTLRHDINARP